MSFIEQHKIDAIECGKWTDLTCLFDLVFIILIFCSFM